MATVPIEIVLQDAETPVDPTPTPESGEETNIIVPSTGTISNDRDSNGGIGSTISIILPIVIAVLALGAMVALLVRRQQKRKNNINANMSKKEKFFVATSGTIAILAATVLVGNLVIPATSAAADETNDNKEGELVVDDKITITVTREADSDNTIVGSIENKSYATVYKSFGYEVAISMAGSNANLYLDGDESSSYYFSPVEDGVLADNTWGYSLDGEGGEYNAVPLADDLAVVDKGAASVTNEEIDIYYGIKVTNDMPAGTYTGELEYTLADTGFPVSLRSMQDMTTDICSSVPTPEPFKADGTTIEDNVPTIMLKDVRDNKLYRVAKLADGKCWMTQNLDLQKEDLVVASLDSTNTDNPVEDFVLPDSQKDNTIAWGGETNTLHVYDIAGNGHTYYQCLEAQRGNCVSWSTEPIPSANLGNLYNWYTATAGTGTYETTGDAPAAGSICPKGWRLPNGAAIGTATDYSTLLYKYGILQSATEDGGNEDKYPDLFITPLLFIRAGAYSNYLDAVGVSGNLWSSMPGDSEVRAQSWGISGLPDYSGVGRGNAFKFAGVSIRCVAE